MTMLESEKNNGMDPVEGVLSRLAAPGNEPLHPPVDDITRARTIDGALSRMAQPTQARMANGLWAVPLAAALVVGVALVVWWGADESELAGAQSGNRGASLQEAYVPRSHFTLLHGEVDCADQSVQLGASVPVDEWIETGVGHGAFALPTGIAVGMSKDTAVRVSWDGKRKYGVEISAGMGLFSVDPGMARGGFVVRTPEGNIHVTGTLFTVVVRDSGRVEVHLHKGTVELEQRGRRGPKVRRGEVVEMTSQAIRPLSHPRGDVARQIQQVGCLDGGQVFSELKGQCDSASAPITEPTSSAGAMVRSSRQAGGLQYKFQDSKVEKEDPAQPRSKKADPSALLTSARDARLRGNYVEAAALLSQLVGNHPGSNDARTALVSLAQMELKRLGNPASAARHFAAYLQRPGPLTREALYGHSKALRALGNQDGERAALERLVREFPGGPAERAAKKRLVELAR